MTIFKVGVSGSRLVGDLELITAETILRQILSELRPGVDELHHGDAEGIDKLAAGIAEEYGIKPVPHHPRVRQWAGEGGFKWRNMKLVNSINKLYALHSSRSRTGGTIWTYNYAINRGIDAEWIELEKFEEVTK